MQKLDLIWFFIDFFNTNIGLYFSETNIICDDVISKTEWTCLN